MNNELLILLVWISRHLYRPFSSFLLRPPQNPRKWLFLNLVLQFEKYDLSHLNLHYYIHAKRMVGKINAIFRINLIKPCKWLKKVISCSPYDPKRSTCQYHGIRYWVRPEMEFGKRYEPILGRLNVKQSTKQ